MTTASAAFNVKEDKIIMLGGKHSYFTAKLRSYLRYKGDEGVLFEEQLSTLDIYKKVILPEVGVNFIPVVLIVDRKSGVIKKAIQDTALIIEHVEQLRIKGSLSIYPNNDKPILNFIGNLFELYGDCNMLFPGMHYRWSFLEHNQPYLVYEWGRVSKPDETIENRDKVVLAGDEKKGPAFSTMKNSSPVLGVNNVTIPIIEKHFLLLLQKLEAHFRKHNFLLGGRPCLGDFGLMGPFFGHLFQDPYPAFILRSKAPAFCAYLERMNGLTPAYEGVRNLSRAKIGRVHPTGDFFYSEEELPATLIALVADVFEEVKELFLPIARYVKNFLVKNPQYGSGTVQLPRVIGFEKFTLHGVESERAVFSFDYWKLQRLLDSVKGKEAVINSWLKTVAKVNEPESFLTAVDSNNRERLILKHFKLYQNSDKNSLVQSLL